jgi:hypothetical protein
VRVASICSALLAAEFLLLLLLLLLPGFPTILAAAKHDSL